MLCIWRNDPTPGVWNHSERKGITAGTAGLSLSWAMSEGLSDSTSLSWGAWLSSVYPDTGEGYIRTNISAASSGISLQDQSVQNVAA